MSKHDSWSIAFPSADGQQQVHNIKRHYVKAAQPDVPSGITPKTPDVTASGTVGSLDDVAKVGEEVVRYTEAQTGRKVMVRRLTLKNHGDCWSWDIDLKFL